MIDNKKVYDDPAVIRQYSDIFYLDNPELAILYEYKDKLKSWKMLDIGVGGGRTTRYFSDLAEQYVGIDFSRGMIEICKKRFDRRFEVCDARDLNMFEDSYFDFVMFSFNGIDTISHEGRLKALKEIRRVLKNEGIFFFSSHNLNDIDRLYSLKLSIRPAGLYGNYKSLLLRLKNKPYYHLKKQAHCTIKDVIENYYISPGEQIMQLENAGFKNVRVLSLKDGCEIKEHLDLADDHWLHYLCEKSSSWQPHHPEETGMFPDRMPVPARQTHSCNSRRRIDIRARAIAVFGLIFEITGLRVPAAESDMRPAYTHGDKRG